MVNTVCHALHRPAPVSFPSLRFAANWFERVPSGAFKQMQKLVAYFQAARLKHNAMEDGWERGREQEGGEQEGREGSARAD